MSSYVASILESLKNHLESIPDEHATRIITNEIIPFCNKECMQRGIRKIFDNYNFRQQQIFGIMKLHWKHVVLNPKRTGKDAWSVEDPILNNIEMKSIANDTCMNPLSLSFPFDKQNDPKRRKETLEYDAFVFGIFYLEKLQILIIAEDKDTIEHLRLLLHNLQTAFIAKWDANVSAGKRGGHDAVRICIKQMLIGDYNWNLWVNNTWSKNISSKDCLDKLKEIQQTDTHLADAFNTLRILK